MRKILSLTLALILILLAVTSCGGEGVTPEDPEDDIPNASEYASRDVTGRNVAYVKMNMKGYGTITLLLDATSAPRTVANFLTLAKSGFYDGTSFHAAQKLSADAAVMFGADPTVDGKPGTDESVIGEFSLNGYDNDLSHKRGVISMYHSDRSMDDANSCFFFTNADVEFLDGYYAPFGYVVDGYAILEKMMEIGIYYTNSQTGLILKSRRPVITSITVEQDIDYSLVADVYVAPPTESELSGAFDEGEEVKKISTSYASPAVLRSYESEDSYAFQMTKKVDDTIANLLISAGANGSITKVTALPLTTGIEANDIAALEGLTLETLDAAELPDSLKSLARDALRTLKALESDGTKSNYFYTRDTEGRETYTVEMKVQGYDTPVVILLDKTTAPITVSNFLALVEKGFYNGLDFHRIIKGFMIQGGDDTHLPAEEQAASIKGEFATGGHLNDIKHVRGVISMARLSSDPDSAGSGFFICDADAPHLNGNYAAFGYVISGMETVDAIADYSVGKTDSNGNLNTGVDQPVIEYIKIVTTAD